MVNTKIPGVVFCETMPQIAKIADKITVIRSMTHGEAAHERGTHTMFTGYQPSPAMVFPSMGSVMSHELGPRENLPPYVCIPNEPNPYAGTGYLSSSFGPFSLGADPAGRGFKVRDLSLPQGIDAQRFARAANDARSRQRPLCPGGEVRRPFGHGHLLPAGLQPDQRRPRPARRSTSMPSRRRSARPTG